MNLLAKVGFTLHLPGSFRQYTPLLPLRIAEDCNEHQSVRKVSQIPIGSLKLTGRLLTKVPCIASLARWAARVSN